MILTTTYGAFVELVQRRLQNDWPAGEFTVTDNEILLHTYSAIATVATAVANNAYAVEGIQSLPDAYYTKYKFDLSTISKDVDTGDYQIPLPVTPIGLREGVSMRSPVFIANATTSYPLIYIHGYSRNYSLKMAKPGFGAYWWVDGSTLYISCPDTELITSGWKLQVLMLANKGKTENDTINLPDEAIGQVFDIVVAKLMQRVSTPKDKVLDGSDKKTEP